MSKINHVWVIEYFDTEAWKWLPWNCYAKSSRKEAGQFMKDISSVNTKFRLRKYEATS